MIEPGDGQPRGGFEGELDRRLAELAHAKEPPRLLPLADMLALAAITLGSFVAVLVAQQP